MTEGKAMFLMLLFFLIGAVIGEIMYRLKRRRLRKESNLSDYGISLEICRAQYYFNGIMVLLGIIAGILFIAYMIHTWDKPL